MPTMRANKLNKASKNTGNRDTTGPLAKGDSSGHKTGSPSINRSGQPRTFNAVLAEALRQKLAETSSPEQRTYASTMADEVIEKAAPTNAKPDGKIPTDPSERLELLKRIFARALERNAQQFNNG